MRAAAFALLLSVLPTFAESFAELLKAANGGDADAQFRVAMAYHYGKQNADGDAGKKMLKNLTGLEAKEIPPQNQALGLRFRVMAVNQKFPPALAFHGGFIYLNQHNANAALPFLLGAANQGDGDAMASLSNIYFARKDVAEGLKWSILGSRYGGAFKDDEPRLVTKPDSQVLANIVFPAGVREAWKRAEAFVPKKVFAGGYSPTKRRGVELDDLLTVAERVQRGAR